VYVYVGSRARTQEKLLWACVFWLLSAALGGMPVGEVATTHRDHVAALTAELLPLTHASLAPAAVDGTYHRADGPR
jgi:hypothetical protein